MSRKVMHVALSVLYSSFSVDSFLQQQQLEPSTTKKPSLDAARMKSLSNSASPSSSSSSSGFCCQTSRLFLHLQLLIAAAATAMVFAIGRLHTLTVR